MDHGSPIAYTALAEGTTVHSSDGVEVGTVKRVLADEAANLFDGIVVSTSDGDRFVDAPEVGDLYERLVTLKLTADETRALDEPSPSPAAVRVSPDDISGDNPGGRTRGVLRRAWDRISGKY